MENETLKKSELRKGLSSGLPIALGYLPYGIAYGLIAKETGLTFVQTLTMSAFVYAGTAQFLIVSMMHSFQPTLSIIFTVFMVNSRYILMSGALVPAMKQWDHLSRFLISYYVSDETFVVLSQRSENHPLSRSYATGVNSTALIGWLLSSLIGYRVGDVINLKQFGFDFALIAVLVALAALMIKNRLSLLIGIVSATITIALHLVGLQKVSILLGALLASALGILYTWNKTRSI